MLIVTFGQARTPNAANRERTGSVTSATKRVASPQETTVSSSAWTGCNCRTGCSNRSSRILNSRMEENEPRLKESGQPFPVKLKRFGGFRFDLHRERLEPEKTGRLALKAFGSVGYAVTGREVLRRDLRH